MILYTFSLIFLKIQKKVNKFMNKLWDIYFMILDQPGLSQILDTGGTRLFSLSYMLPGN